ncbi:MAG: glucose-6-phosphate isomerase [Clostridia bacterium]|nr:glucose-6-phosphate isomerase [Clostridia bacterium]
MLKINYYGVLEENVSSHGISLKDLEGYKDLAKTAINSIYNVRANSMLGWIDLPDTDKKLLDEINTVATNIRNNFDNFVVLGIGGSALGTKALYQAFAKKHKAMEKQIYCTVCDNIDPDTFVTLLNEIDLNKTMFNVITKSGGTSETLIQMRLVIDLYNKMGVDYKEHFIVTTETGNKLDAFAKANGIPTFEVPKSVGGRFSVLSPVGLLPASVYGIDIAGLMKGADNIRKSAKNEDITSNLTMLSALINYISYQKGKNELVFMPYSDTLALMTDYFAQLWAESLGKEVDLDGKVVNHGQVPIKTVGVTDQHSQLQLYEEGPNNKIFTFLGVEKPLIDMTTSSESPIEGYDYLNNLSIKHLLDLEQHCTAYALIKQDRPNYTLTLSKVDEENVGELMYYMQMLTAFMGEFLHINTYNQPGVEQGKIYAKALLNVEGFEAQKKEIEEYTLKSKKYEF